MQIVTVGYGPRILRYRSKDFETSEQFSATFDLSRIDVLRGTCSGHLALKGALHSPGEAEIFLWRRRRTQEHKCIGGSASSCGVLDRSISTVLSFESSTPGGACQISFTFSANVKFYTFSEVFLCVRIAVSQGCACCLRVSHDRSHETSSILVRNVLVVEEMY